MNRSPIPWLGADGFTWNPITGCTFGCPWCYARRITKAGPTRGGFPNGFEPTMHTSRLTEPVARKKPATIFLGSMGDLFDPAFPDSFRDLIFAAVGATPQHRYVVLTKRAEAMRRYFSEGDRFTQVYASNLGKYVHDIPANLMLGVTVTNQADADERIPLLLDTPAAYRMVSVEPMLGPVDLSRWTGNLRIPCSCGHVFDTATTDRCDHTDHWSMKCPACGTCKCDKVDEWGQAGRLVPVDPQTNFGFTHRHPACEPHPLLDFVAIGAKTPGKPLHDTPGCDAYKDYLCDMAIWVERCADRDSCPGHDLRWLLEQCGKAGVPVNYKHGNTTPAVDGKVYDATIAKVMSR